MCELIVQIEEKRPKRVDVRLYVRDGEGVTDGERHVAVVLSDALNQKLRVAAQLSCEKVWQLPCDEELRPLLDSPFADLRNSVPGNPDSAEPRLIDCGAAQLLKMPLQPKKRLKRLTLRTLSNDVVIGLMAVTLTK